MKDEHRANLLKLADYVESHVSDDEFDMLSYWNHCGADGCLLGHSINADIIAKEDLPMTMEAQDCDPSLPNWRRVAYDYEELCRMLFGVLRGCDWGFLFSSHWGNGSAQGSSPRLDGVKRLRMFAADPEIYRRSTRQNIFSVFRDRSLFWDNEKFVFVDQGDHDAN